MSRYEVAGWFRVYVASGLVVSIGGGSVMLVLAGIAHSSASIVLVVLGGLWLLMGALGLRRWRRTARVVELSEADITFLGPHLRVQMPIRDVLEVHQASGDINAMMPLRVLTREYGVVRVAPRLRGGLDLLVRVRAASPDTVIS